MDTAVGGKKKIISIQDLGVALYLLFAFVFLIVPMPNTLLDIMLALNMAVAFAILFNTLFVNEVLEMSFYPTVLLFTTIFRISLNVSSTKLILSTGDPGNVVRTFGQFVGGNDLIIGTIVYIILIILQFVVINKGSERIAEVSARFSLDAMPGKQMAIDADLNTGAITDEEAKAKRKELQDESSRCLWVILWSPHFRPSLPYLGTGSGRVFHLEREEDWETQGD